MQLPCTAGRQADIQVCTPATGRRVRGVANADWSVNMPHGIAHIFELMLRLVWPREGRRRRAGCRSAAVDIGAPTVRLFHVPVPKFQCEEIGTVCSYLVAHVLQETRRQQVWRRALWLAAHGIDIGPRLIHSVEVTA